MRIFKIRFNVIYEKSNKKQEEIKEFTGIDDLDSLSKTIIDVANLYNSNPIKEETI